MSKDGLVTQTNAMVAVTGEGRQTGGVKVPLGATWAPPGAAASELPLYRKRHAMEMRAEGATYESIAIEIGTTENRAREIVRSGLRQSLQEPSEEIRYQEHFRLERLMTVVWPRAMKGDGFAVDRVLRIMERKARMLGLDAPAELDVRQIRVELFSVLRDSLDPATYQKVLEAVAD